MHHLASFACALPTLLLYTIGLSLAAMLSVAEKVKLHQLYAPEPGKAPVSIPGVRVPIFRFGLLYRVMPTHGGILSRRCGSSSSSFVLRSYGMTCRFKLLDFHSC